MISFTFIHNSIFKNTYRCRFIHRDLSFLTLFLFTFSICDGHSKFLFKSIKAFNRSFFAACLEQVCLYSAWRKKTGQCKTQTADCRLRTRGNWLPSVQSFWRAVQDHPFEILLLPFSRSGLPFKNFFSRLDVITIRSKFFASRSAVIPIRSE